MRLLSALILLLAAPALAQEPIPGANYPQPLFGTTNTWAPLAFGIYNDATAFSANINPRGLAEVNGFHGPFEMADFPDRGVVTLYAGAYGVPVMATAAGASYTLTQLIPATPLDAATVANIQRAVAQCQRNNRVVCMMIDTNHSPKYTGSITGVAPNGSSVTVTGWFKQGNRAVGQLPPGTADAYINPITKVWNMNGVLKLQADSFTKEGTFLEGDIYNYLAPYTGSGTIPVLGVSMNCNANDCGYGFVGLSNWFAGFMSRGNTYAGFQVQNASGGTEPNPLYGFQSKVAASTAHHPFIYTPSDAPIPNTPVWSVASNGNTQVGDTVSANGLSLQAAVLGAPVVIQAIGADTNVSIRLAPRGTGNVRNSGDYVSIMPASQNGHPFMVQPSDQPGKTTFSMQSNGSMFVGDSSTLNGFSIATAAAGSPPIIQALGVDTNIDLRLVAKGTGSVRVTGGFTTATGTLETPTTVAGLGTCTTALKGKRWAVTDATAQTFGATLAGGGSITTSAFCNGTNWINL